jgi:hypothetical protein
LDFPKHQDWRKKFGPSGEGNKENEEKSASGVKTKSKPSKKTKKIKNVNSNNNNKTAKWSMSSVQRSIQMSNKKASGDGWLGLAASKRASEPHIISFWR